MHALGTACVRSRVVEGAVEGAVEVAVEGAPASKWEVTLPPFFSMPMGGS